MDCGSVILTPLHSHPSPPSPPSGPWILEPQIIGPLREPWAGFWIPDFHAIRSPSTSFELNLDAVLHQVRCSPAAAFLESGFWISRYLGAFFGVTCKVPPPSPPGRSLGSWILDLTLRISPKKAISFRSKIQDPESGSSHCPAGTARGPDPGFWILDPEVTSRKDASKKIV